MERTEKGFVLGGDPGWSQATTGRGATVYNLASLLSVRGETRTGEKVQGDYVQPLFILTREERQNIFQSCDPVFSLVTSRMNRVAGLNWHIVPVKEILDRKIARFEDIARLWREFADPESMVDKLVRARIIGWLRRDMVELKEDMSNFSGCLFRYKRRAMDGEHDKAKEIEAWVKEPTLGVKWSDFVKKYIFDLMVHGNAAVIKMPSGDSGLVENFDTLMGGTVMPLQSAYAGGPVAYAQIIPTQEPQIFFGDELSYRNYIPSSARSYGWIPLEALVNRISEYLLFDRRMAEQSDGTKPPDKALIFGASNPFETALQDDKDIPLDDGEQKRLETKLNMARKEAMAVLSGVGTPMVVDLTRDFNNPLYDARQERILKSVAMAFNASNNEINLTGSGDTSGRSTSEAQERQDLGKGVTPMVAMLEETINQDILPFRWGTGFVLEFQGGMTEMAELDKYKKLLEVGASINDIQELRNQPRYEGEEYDQPMVLQRAAQQVKTMGDLMGGGQQGGAQ